MRLSDFYIPLLAYVRDFELSPTGSAEDLSMRIENFVEKAKKEALASGFSLDKFNQGLFPVVAWIDERISAMKSWDGNYDWQKFLLQRRYFKTSLAGVEFYKRLSNLSDQSEDIRELYFIALCMGFLGKYTNNPKDDELAELKQSQYQLISTADKSKISIWQTTESQLFPFAYQSKKPVFVKNDDSWLSWFTPQNILIFIVPPVVLLLLIVYLNWQLSTEIDRFRDLISK